MRTSVYHCLLLAGLLLPNAQSFAVEKPKPGQPEWRYSVRPGDSLFHISNQHLINPNDWRILQKLNHITNPYRIQPGKVLRMPLHLVKQVPASAEVIFFSGKAGILGANKSIVPVAVGQQLVAGTALVTDQKGKLNIKFADGSIVSMQPNSTLRLDALSVYSGGGMVDTKLRLQQGRVETKANPTHIKGNKMQIVTPTAVAAVRGTQFRVSSVNDTVIQETLEGKVALTAAGAEVPVDKGYGTISEGGARPLPPTLLLSAPATEKLATQLEALPIVFNMPAQAGAVAWLGSLSTEATFAAEKLSQGTQLSFNDLPDGNYTLKVRAKDAKGIEGYDATHQFVLNAQPYAPKASAPAPAATVRDASPELSWEQVAQINTYLVEVARDADFKQLLDSRRVTNTTYKIEKQLEPGQYYWRLASIDGAEQGPYAAVNHFTYKSKLGAPDIGSLKVHVHNNKVFVNTADAPDGLSYKIALHNERNNQKNVWQANTANGEFSFLLREFGKQTLSLQLVDVDGDAGSEAIYEFDALPYQQSSEVLQQARKQEVLKEAHQ